MANFVKTLQADKLDLLESKIQDFFTSNKKIKVISINYDTFMKKWYEWSSGNIEVMEKEYSVVIVYQKELEDIIYE